MFPYFYRPILAAFILVSCCMLSTAAAQTLPEGLKFKRIKKDQDSLTLKNCNLFNNVKRFTVTKKGKNITPPASAKRKNYKLPEKYTFFGCHTDGAVTSLYVKKTAKGAVSQFSFSADDFPERSNNGGGDNNGGSGLNSVCPKGTRGISGGMLYKPAADASDARQGKPAILFTGGSKTRASAIRIFASDGTEVCKFTFKASSIPGVNGGADHYFSGWSGGCGSTGSQIAGAARSASGNSNIYFEWKGGVCIGPLNPSSRAGGI